MPTYEYRCSRGHEFEVFQRMSDEPRSECPECGAEVERILSGGAGVLFRGEGFYATDYRSSEYEEKASAERGEGGSSEEGAKKGDGVGGEGSDSGSSSSDSGSSPATSDEG